MIPGRKSAQLWAKFEKLGKEGNFGWWEVCKKCNEGMQGIPERLKKHVKTSESEIPKNFSNQLLH